MTYEEQLRFLNEYGELTDDVLFEELCNLEDKEWLNKKQQKK